MATIRAKSSHRGGCLEAGSHGDGTLVLRRSKTDQEGQGSVRYLAPDTMRAVGAWLDAAGHREGALFRSVGKGGRVGGPLDPGDVARVFKAMAKADHGDDPRQILTQGWLPLGVQAAAVAATRTAAARAAC